jgi:hypothetical protein
LGLEELIGIQKEFSRKRPFKRYYKESKDNPPVQRIELVITYIDLDEMRANIFMELVR